MLKYRRKMLKKIALYGIIERQVILAIGGECYNAIKIF